MNFKKVVVAGGGVLGSQIAYQSAFKGFDVTFWLRSEDSVKRTMPKVERLHKIYIDELESYKSMIGNPSARFARGMVADAASLTVEKIEELKKDADRAFENLKYEVDLNKAVEDADVIIESVAEIPQAKKDFYQELSKYLPEKTLILTNTSSLLPSLFAEDTGRPDRYLAMHFANSIWKNNLSEVMMQSKTDPKYLDITAEFANAIGMIPIKIKKEQPGYALNSLLIPFLNAAEQLLAKEVADPEEIDKAWMIGTGAPIGPFRILDIVGLETACNIAKMAPGADNPEHVNYKIVEKLESYISQGKTGVNAGEGFYKYK